MGLPGSSAVKNSPANVVMRILFSLVWRIPWRKTWQPIPVFSSGKSHR